MSISKNEIIKKVSSFIESLQNIEDNSSVQEFELFFSIVDEGTLLLSGDDAKNYRETLRSLIEFVKDETISQKGIEDLFQKTILSVIDIKEKRKEKTFDQRLKEALNDLIKSLTATPIAFKVFYPVHGLVIDNSSIHVGNVQFCRFNDYSLRVFTKLLESGDGDDNDKKIKAYITDQIKETEINGKPVGLITVKAVDPEAAKLLALKELSITLDVINFFSDLVPYQKGCIYLPGDSERLAIDILVISEGENPKWTFGKSVVGQIMPFSFSKLLEADKKQKLGFRKVNKLLGKKRNGLEDKLISAMQWAGKATVERRKEESFLLYAISLESLVLADNEKDELKYRLRQRVVHLISKKDKESRERVFQKAGELYDIRSKIVHSGDYQVTDADLSLMRYYSKSCILRILNKKPFSTMESVDSLVKWFNRKILG